MIWLYLWVSLGGLKPHWIPIETPMPSVERCEAIGAAMASAGHWSCSSYPDDPPRWEPKQ